MQKGVNWRPPPQTIINRFYSQCDRQVYFYTLVESVVRIETTIYVLATFGTTSTNAGCRLKSVPRLSWQSLVSVISDTSWRLFVLLFAIPDCYVKLASGGRVAPKKFTSIMGNLWWNFACNFKVNIAYFSRHQDLHIHSVRAWLIL